MHTAQELGCVINHSSINERFPTLLYLISPPPYLNGVPNESLSWIIESRDPSFEPETLMRLLEGRLPQPVDELDA